MEIQTLLSLCQDIAHFLFSILHLLLTRILPLIAILLLYVLRFIVSFLFPVRPGFSMKDRFLKKSRTLQGRSTTAETAIHGSAAFYRDAPQEELITSDEDRDFAEQEELICGDEPYTDHLQEECLEGCLDADFIEGQRLLLSQYEEMKLRARNPAANGEMSEAGFEQTTRNPAGDSLMQRVSDDFRQGTAHEYLLQKHLANRVHSLQKSGERGADRVRKVGNSVQEEVGYLGKDEMREDAAGQLKSQPSHFPSDLPPTLDDVVRAAAEAAAKDDAVIRSGHASSLTRRALPPTLSDVQKALRDMHAEEISPHAPPFSQEHQPANPAAPTDNFLRKFAHHFKLDGCV